jgi:predicted nucleic acid-binding Zn ribbon protein
VATYCFRCPECGHTTVATIRSLSDGSPLPCVCTANMVRDYRAEAVNVGPNVLVSKRSLDNLGPAPGV